MYNVQNFQVENSVAQMRIDNLLSCQKKENVMKKICRYTLHRTGVISCL